MTEKKRAQKDPTLVGAEVRTVLSDIEKTHGRGSILCLGDQPEAAPIDIIPSGALSLDHALGIGGYPRGRIVEIFGPESSGKTTLTLHAVAQVQRAGGVAAFIDAEHALDVRYAAGIGVDTSRLLVSQPDFGEQALDIAEMLAKSGVVDLVVVDSVAALTPKAEIEGHVGDHHVGLHARLMSQALRKLAGAANRTGTTIAFINQLRQKIGVFFGSPETTTGGQALKFYSSVRLDVRRIGKVSIGDQAVGNRTRVKVVKNKCAPPFQEAEFDIRWGLGIDPVGDLLDLADVHGVVAKNGSHYAIDGKSFAQGREKARDVLIGDAALCKRIEQAVVTALFGPAPAEKKAA